MDILLELKLTNHRNSLKTPQLYKCSQTFSLEHNWQNSSQHMKYKNQNKKHPEVWTQ